MRSLINQIKELQKSKINDLVESRILEFNSFKDKSEDDWFQELCFCILAANSKQKTAENIQKSLGNKILTISQSDLSKFIRDSKHRFHNNKAKYIIEARSFIPIKDKLQNLNEIEARNILAKNIKGLGMKEASHFLRNIGFSKNLAIIDRHIINILSENNIMEKPKTISPKIYLEAEEKFNKIAKELNISSSKLDLLMWYLKTGEIAK